VETLFDRVAPRYDFLNHVFSLGLDYTWRWRAVRALAPRVDGPILDGATGTGDLAIALAKGYPERHIVGLDFSEGMLAVGRRKIREKGFDSRIDLRHGDLTALPFDDASFAGAGVGFGIRNVGDREKALTELRRVLKPGGRLLILDFAMPTLPVFAPIYRLYFSHFMPMTAGLFGLGETYRYLFESVDAFPSRNEFLGSLMGAGFARVWDAPMTFGTVMMYFGDIGFDLPAS
jgi:demethylmenaquinone methyltransferase/2-methoxy-6-polyprenyl-1,4-benzoquinol methylase